MSQSDLISQQIIVSLKKEKKSLYMRFSEASGAVVLDFSKDIGFLIYEYFDADNRGRNRDETIRLIKMLKRLRGFYSSEIKKLIKIVIERFTRNITGEMIEKLPKIIGKMAGQTFINTVLLQDISSFFTEKLINKAALNTIVSTGIMLGGARARAIYGSQELFSTSTEMYYLLKNKGDMDLLYFTVSEFLNPFIKAISIAKEDPEEFEKIIINVINGIDG